MAKPKITTPDGAPASYKVKELKVKTPEEAKELKKKAAAKPAAKKTPAKKAGK